jgi:hypothetical protein
MVSIQGKNFNPKWVLFNGALGTLIDFHFSTGSKPNCGELPDYISVEFREYCGPVGDKTRPKVREIQPMDSNNLLSTIIRNTLILFSLYQS